MTAPRVSEAEAERLLCVLELTDDTEDLYSKAATILRSLLAERSALEARLAEARRKNEAMADFYYDAYAKRMVGEDGFVRSLAEAEERASERVDASSVESMLAEAIKGFATEALGLWASIRADSNIGRSFGAVGEIEMLLNFLRRAADGEG